MTTNDPILDQAIAKLAGKVPRALLVGGVVRDFLLGVPTKDADVEVYGISSGELKSVLEKLFDQVDTVGASFGIYKVTLAEGRMLDVAIPRTESKTGKGHKGFEVIGDPALNVTEALRRRDFTVNAIAMDAVTGEVIDPFNGRNDLSARVLRAVDPRTFVEDPLRVFRGVQFSARLHFAIEPKTLALMKQMVQNGELDELSKERVTEEWRKLLLKAERPSLGLALMLELDIIHHYYPELAALVSIPQEPDWHPEGDVWVHTLLALDEAVGISRDSHPLNNPLNNPPHNPLLIPLSTLCHDLGKPLVTKMVEGKLRAFGHEEAGVEPSKSLLSRFTFGDDLTHQVCAITRDHLKPTTLYRSFQKGELNEKQYANAVRRLLKRLGGVPLNVFLAVTEADTRGRGLASDTGEYEPGAFMRQTVSKNDLEIAAKTPLITGAELIAEFGLVEGPKIGEVMKAVELARDNGEIETPEEARELVKKLMYTERK
ncbi:MAG: hypothetical protein WC802_00110 [Patescibacteria group bacterium]|jgi:tRNA nucleotidyltransferase (CCA-adding enzyme)